MTKRPKPIVLTVLDGWGYRAETKGNAIALARKPNYDRLLAQFPNTLVQTSGPAVGLPEGQMGNSEVGHMNIGAGRVVHMDITRIDQAIADGSFFRNELLLQAMQRGQECQLHLLGLLSDGGVHSHIQHLVALLRMAKQNKVERVFVHCFMDGRDTPPHSGMDYLRQLQQQLREIGVGRIASLSGRYYAMDRDKRWERVEKAYACLTEGVGRKAPSALDAVRQSYAEKVTDEFVLPTLIDDGGAGGLIRDGDGVIFFNFRADRARELTRAFTEQGFKEFPRPRRIDLAVFATMTQYDETFGLPVAYQPRELRQILGQVASDNGICQLRIAETEKYAHVTYFFNGGEEKEFPGEQRILIPSPRDVATYDLKPEMSARQVTEALVKKFTAEDIGLVIANFANADMVGHTGNFEASVKACEVIDECLGRVVDAALRKKGRVVITADHGNIEQLIDYDTGKPHTAHTTNLVPLILVDEERKNVQLKQGAARDVAPTLLKLLEIPQPKEMTGHSLIVEV
jgi:2,3-bisphosphoglycerate-independent phosphoglycerate mutase